MASTSRGQSSSSTGESENMLIVQRRNNSTSEEWETITYIRPEEVNQVNAIYGWRKYRIVKKRGNEDA